MDEGRPYSTTQLVYRALVFVPNRSNLFLILFLLPFEE